MIKNYLLEDLYIGSLAKLAGMEEKEMLAIRKDLNCISGLDADIEIMHILEEECDFANILLDYMQSSDPEYLIKTVQKMAKIKEHDIQP